MSAWTSREVLAFLDRIEPALGGLTHFALLDIESSATVEMIRAAFHRLAVRLHPDLYRRVLNAADHERLTAVYARVAEAYMVLRADDHRAAYLAQLSRSPAKTPSRAADPASGGDALAMLDRRAQRLYRRAEAALRRGDVTSAILELRMAAASAPGSALIRDALEEALALRK